MRRILLGAAASVAAACLSGCGRGGDEPFAAATLPVKGTVTYRGRPLDRGTVKFEPEGAGREARGQIGPDGTFTLSTYADGDGAVPGIHRVAVDGSARGDRAAIPARFRNLGSSGLEVDVTPGKSEYSLDLN